MLKDGFLKIFKMSCFFASMMICKIWAISNHEQVQSLLECRIDDAGDLRDYLGVSTHETIVVESLNDGSSTIFAGERILYSGFPAILKLEEEGRRFVFEGSEVYYHHEASNRVVIKIQGSLVKPSTAQFSFLLESRSERIYGKALLSHCVYLEN